MNTVVVQEPREGPTSERLKRGKSRSADSTSPRSQIDRTADHPTLLGSREMTTTTIPPAATADATMTETAVDATTSRGFSPIESSLIELKMPHVGAASSRTAMVDATKTYPPSSATNAVASAISLVSAQIKVRPREETEEGLTARVRTTQGQAVTHASDVGRLVIILTNVTCQTIETKVA